MQTRRGDPSKERKRLGPRAEFLASLGYLLPRCCQHAEAERQGANRCRQPSRQKRWTGAHLHEMFQTYVVLTQTQGDLEQLWLWQFGDPYRTIDRAAD